MAIRAFGRLLFSGFALPKLDPKGPNSGGKYAAKTLFMSLRSRRVLKWMVPGLAFMVLLASTQTSNAATLSSNSNQCQVEVGSTSGVSISLSSNKCVLTFEWWGSHTWTAPAGVTSFDTLVVAGGGGGGADGGSGGGSGSMYEATVNLNGNTGRQFDILVGVGGTRITHTAVGGEAYSPNGSAGGNSSITQSTSGFSVTTYGGSPGVWPDWNISRAGGVGGSQPVVVAGSFSLSSTASHTGRTGAAAPPAGWASSGYNGSNGATSSLFGGTFIGSGGSGAISDGGIRHGGSGGTGGGGVGSGGNFSDNLADYFAGHGGTNTGGGGGGGARNGETYAYTIAGRTDRFRNGG
ncbi:MAG: hypothetical protein F2552_03170, partial [Actinobacteria bacterium]|nr:hypothetical protein [Actinomycetota bacterium]